MNKRKTQPRIRSACWCSAAILAAAATSVHGQGVGAAPPAPAMVTGAPAGAQPETPGTRELQVTPSPPLSRALLWRLRFPAAQQLHGNAAVGYLQVAGAPNLTPEASERVSELLGLPLEQLSVEQADQALSNTYAGVWELLELAARREDCRWETPVREAAIGVLLPELGKMRQLARAAALKARMEIRDGRPRDAIATLRVGMQLGRDVSRGPTLIQALVGVAICQLMLEQVETLIQQPGTPNVYWALTDLGSPLVDMSAALRSEQAFLDYVFPDASLFESAVLSPTAAAEAVARAADQIRKLNDWLGIGGNGKGDLAGAFGAAMQFPAAKAYLLTQGYTAAQVDALPVSYVSMRYSLFRFRAISDELFKWATLPYPQAIEGLKRTEARQGDPSKAMDAQPFVQLIPAVATAMDRGARLERKLAMLRVIEAVRLHAATHNGRAPASLDDVSDLTPLPIDPLTGKVFEYRLEAGGAMLSCPVHESDQARPSELRAYRVYIMPDAPPPTK